jgi:hypothetical protein
MKLLIRIVRGRDSGREKEFVEPGRYVFGCDEDVHFRLSADPFVSGRHFQVDLDSQHCFLQDLGGPNRTRVNDRAVSRVEIRDKDEVQLGSTRLQFLLMKGPICYWCKSAVLEAEEVPRKLTKDPDAETRAVYAHEQCIPRDKVIGRRIGEYVCYRRLGGGTFGEVFLAYESATSRVWAIKTAVQGLGEKELRRFRREARLLQILRHPNIVYCVGAGVDPDGTPYLVSEYVGGGDLQNALKDKGALPVREAVGLMSQLLDALVYLQSPPRQTEHRDIKPANVLFIREQVPRLADFGLGKAFGILATPLTAPETVLGTIQYTAPEIIQSGVSPGDSFDSRLDVYSLGVTFYSMLTLKYPFDFPRSTPAMYAHILSNQTIPLRERNPAIPQSLASVVDKACSKDPAKRFRDAEAFQEAFRKSV